MASSPKQSSAPMQQQQVSAPPPPEVNLTTTGYGNMGYQLPQNPMGMGTPETGQGLAPPNWMQGNFAAPWWGQQAPNVGHAMMQQQGGSGYGGADPAANVAPQGPTGMSEKDIMAMIKAEQERMRAEMQANQYRPPQYNTAGLERFDQQFQGGNQWSPGSLPQDDQQWLQANHPWAASRG